MDKLVLISVIASVVSALTLILVLLKLGKVSAVAQLKADQLTGTAITAKDLAAELGASIESSFKNYVPQPEKAAAALSAAVEQSVKKAAESVDALHKNMLASQTQAAEKWAGHEKGTVASLETAKKALEDAAGKLQSASTAIGQQLDKAATDMASRIKSSFDPSAQALQNALSGHAQQIEKSAADIATRIKASFDPGAQALQSALTNHAQQIEKVETSAREQLKGVLTQHAESLQKASQAIAGQLDKIMQLEKDIQQVLHVQQVTDGTIKAVSTAEEFKQTLLALRKHLEVSDSLIKEVAKPRTIRLVESES